MRLKISAIFECNPRLMHSKQTEPGETFVFPELEMLIVSTGVKSSVYMYLFRLNVLNKSRYA